MYQDEKECFILKGIPGSGKSTAAKTIAGENGKVHEADSYHYNDEGVYDFKFENLGKAHAQCLAQFKESILAGTLRVVQSNTNTTLKAYKEYMKFAREHGYRVTVMTVENHHGGKNIHGVPEAALVKMENELKNSMHLRYQG